MDDLPLFDPRPSAVAPVAPVAAPEEWEPDGPTEMQRRTLRHFEQLERLLVETLPPNAHREPALVAFQMAAAQVRLAYMHRAIEARESPPNERIP